MLVDHTLRNNLKELLSNNFSHNVIRNVFTLDLNCFSSNFMTASFFSSEIIVAASYPVHILCCMNVSECKSMLLKSGLLLHFSRT